MNHFACAGVLALTLLAGCQQQNPNLAKETSENPHFAEAESHLQSNNYVEAVKAYEAALQANPDVASAHYEMARIYSDRLNDPVSAVYHYNQYLAARPESDRREAVEKFRDDAKLAFQVATAQDGVELKQSLARLQNENALLKEKVAKLTEKLSEANAASSQASPPAAEGEESVTTTSTEEIVAAKTDGSQPAVLAAVVAEAKTATEESGMSSKPAAPARTYVLQSGDSLWKIARKFYPDDNDINAVMKRIREANPETLANDRNLKIGTEIVLP